MMPSAQLMMVIIPPAMTTASPLIMLLPVMKEKPPPVHVNNQCTSTVMWNPCCHVVIFITYVAIAELYPEQ